MFGRIYCDKDSDRPGYGGDPGHPGQECGLDKRQTILDREVTGLIKGFGDKNRHFVGGMGPLTHH